MFGSKTAAIIAMIAMMQTISRRVNPSSVLASLLIARRGYIRCRAGPAFLPIGAIRHDFVFGSLRRRPIEIGLAPRIIRHIAALKIGTIPSAHGTCRLDEHGQPLSR